MEDRGSISYSNIAMANGAALVVARAVGLTGYHVFNPGANATYLRFYDAAAAASVTVGTTVPTFVLGIPAAGGATRSMTKPIRFANGIVLSCSNTANANGAPTANNIVELEYTR